MTSAGAAVLGCLLLAPAAFAADGESTPLNLDTPKAAAQQAVPGGGGGGLVRTIVGLAIVIGVIYGLSWVLKLLKSSKEERHSGSGLAPLATLPLGPNRSLHLVRAGGEVVLVGVGEHGVTPIRTYGEHEARALGLLGPDGDPRDGDGPQADAIALPGVPAAKPTVRESLRRSLDDLRTKTVIR
jgi:flagellar protein FliO/FliZ